MKTISPSGELFVPSLGDFIVFAAYNGEALSNFSFTHLRSQVAICAENLRGICVPKLIANGINGGP